VIWAIALGMVAPWVVIIPAWLLIDRYRDRRAVRLAQARWQAWAAAHPREASDEHARLAQIHDQLWLEGMPAHVRAHILRQRLEDAEREERAKTLLEAEQRGETDGQGVPYENRLR
jgi:hypothetical protein